MVFRNRGRSNNRLRPINRIKHVFDSQLGVALGVVTSRNIITANDNPALANTAEVETGSTVNGIYLKVEAYATTSGALSNLYMIVFKNPGGNIGVPAPNLVGANDNKRFVIHQEMVMLQKEINGNPRTLFNGVIVIPRGYRRFGPNDILSLSFLSPGVNVDLCLQVHYKEFR